MSTCTTPAGDRLSSARWWVCLLLFAATTLNYMDRQILSVLKPILDDQIHWTNREFGLINAVFQGAYALSMVLWGWFLDRRSLKVGFALIVAIWSLAALGHVVVATVAGFVLARFLLGLGEGGNFPAAIKTVGEWFPARERSLATAVFNSGSNVASVLVPAVIPVIAFTWGWQCSFVVPAALGILWIAVWLVCYKPAGGPKTAVTGVTAAPSSGKLPWSRLLRVRQTWAFIAAKFLTDPVWWFLLIWLPDYFKKTRGLDIRQSWVHLVSIYAIVTVLSLGGGWITGHLIGKGWSPTRARKTGMLGFALLVVPVGMVSFVGDWTAVALIGLAGAAHQSWSANLFTTVSDVFPGKSVASVVGLGGMAGAAGGMIFPLICGVILDFYPTNGYTLLFAGCGAAYLVAFALNHVLSPTFNPLPEQKILP